MKGLKTWLAAAAVTTTLALGGTAQADLLAKWNFNDSAATGSPGTVDLVVDGGVFNSSSATPATISHNLAGTNGAGTTNTYGSFGGSTVNADGSDVAGRDFGIVGSGQNGLTVTFAVPTVGFEDIIVSWAVRITSTGHDDTAFEWSTNGTDWNTIIDPVTVSATSTYEAKSYDLSSVTGVDNQSAVQFRLTFGSASATNGSFRLDNVLFSGTSVPEPASMAMLAMGGLLLTRRRRLA
jgi:hypothetical protein